MAINNINMKQKLTILLLVFSFGLSAQTIDTLGAISFPDTNATLNDYDNAGFAIHTFNDSGEIVINFKAIADTGFIDLSQFHYGSGCFPKLNSFWWTILDSNGDTIQPSATNGDTIVNPFNGTNLRDWDYYTNLNKCEWYTAKIK